MKTLALDSSFSVYGLVNQFSIHNIIASDIRLLTHWSHQIEVQAREKALPVDFFAAFQQLHHFLSVSQHYQALAATARSVTIFGEPDVFVPSYAGIQVVALHRHAVLAREWFVIAAHPTFARAVIARETTPPGTPRQKRLFEGILTSDPALVDEVAHAIQAHLGAAATS
ncbi:MAG: DICT sensory domain-containing protein [bacterium]|nr:DICT sensory domain-containing protein [bacterium]